MKKTFLTITLLISCSCLFSQDISGTWAGFFTAQTKNFPHNYYFFLEIKQKGKTIWGTYNTSDSMNNVNISCLGSVSGILSKKVATTFDLYKERIEDFDKNTVTYAICNFVNRLALHYFTKDNMEYLTGQWYSESGSGPLAGGASGSFVVQHINSQTMHDVDHFFPKLNKLIEKGATEESVVIKADDISIANPVEQRLLETIKSMLGKKSQ